MKKGRKERQRGRSRVGDEGRERVNRRDGEKIGKYWEGDRKREKRRERKGDSKGIDREFQEGREKGRKGMEVKGRDRWR